MIIENVEALKTWLTKTLSPICDADPAALAKYVVALVKKDKPENELNDNLTDQLDVFLQQRTRPFVDGLFEALKTKSYINSSSNGMSSVAVVSSANPQGSNNSHPGNNLLIQNNNHSSSSGSQSSTKLDRKRKIPDGSDAGPSEEDKDHRKKRSRSNSPKGGGRPGDDRRRRHDDRRFNRRRSRERSRSKSPRGKSRERLRPTRDLNRERERSRSPGVRPFGARSRSRSRSWSPPRSRSRSRSRGHKDPDSRGSTPLQDSGNYNVPPPPVQAPTCSSPVSTVSSAISVVSHWDTNRNAPVATPSDAPPPPATTAPPNVGNNRPRCRDYDEKGYCMRGDLCPYDHGLDPVIVEDVNLPNVLSFPHGHGPPTSHGGPGFIGPRIPPLGPPHLPQMGPRVPPPRPTRPVETYPPEGYNPEAPAINPPRPSFWVGPRGPRPNQPFYSQPPRQRDLVSVPTIPDISKPQNLDNKPCNESISVTNRTVIPPKRDYMSSNDANKHHPPPSHQQPHYQQHKNIQQNFQGGYGRPVPRYLNTTLEVRKIPREQNNIAKLNEHFGKFGVLKNIQISFENDPEAALITFANHTQANMAYRSSEPVFNNRFIKVFWHREKLPEQKPVSAETPAPPVVPTPVNTSSDHRMPVKARLGIPTPNLLSLDNTLPKKTETAEKAIVYTSSVGHLTKTVFNPAAMKPKAIPLTSNTTTITPSVQTKTNSSDSTSHKILDTANVKKVGVPKKDTILKNVQKQKHELLSNYLQQQRLLIKKFEDKNSSADTKVKIKKEMDDLTNIIRKFQEELVPKKKSTEITKIKPGATVAGPSNSQKTQREILDTELELISKQKSGEDTTELRKKLIELTHEAASLGLLPRGRGRGVIRGGMRIRGGGSWSRGGRSLKMSASCRSLDNRPKQIHVSGFEGEQLKNILAHFSLFCEVVKSESDATDTNVVLTFKSRQDAEKAVIKCSRYRDRDLKIRWYTPSIPTTPNNADTSAELDDTLTQSPTDFTDLEVGALLGGEDEDEEDEESRSWRR